MRLNSLSFRLLAVAAVWTLVGLPIAGLMIYSFYHRDVEQSFNSRLGTLLTVVMADSIDHATPDPAAPRDVGEPLFDVQPRPQKQPFHVLPALLFERPADRLGRQLEGPIPIGTGAGQGILLLGAGRRAAGRTGRALGRVGHPAFGAVAHEGCLPTSSRARVSLE